MFTIGRQELEQRAALFIERLREKDIEGRLLPETFRDYQVKIAIRRNGREYGNTVLYYKPTKKSFSCKFHEMIDRSLTSELENCWHATPTIDTMYPLAHHIYVDGSARNGVVGFGVVILKDNRRIVQWNGKLTANQVGNANNVAGELHAVIEALQWCRQNGISEVAIFYDMEGIEKWATGEWKTNTPVTKNYANTVRKSGITIHWQKVQSHTGDRWNEEADRLARSALDSP